MAYYFTVIYYLPGILFSLALYPHNVNKFVLIVSYLYVAIVLSQQNLLTFYKPTQPNPTQSQNGAFHRSRNYTNSGVQLADPLPKMVPRSPNFCCPSLQGSMQKMRLIDGSINGHPMTATPHQPHPRCQPSRPRHRHPPTRCRPPRCPRRQRHQRRPPHL